MPRSAPRGSARRSPTRRPRRWPRRSSNRRRPACTSPRASSSSARAASRIICEPSTASRPSSVISSRIRSAAARSPSSSGSIALPTRIARASSSACSRTRIGQAASACWAAPAWSPRTMASCASWACSVASRYGVSGRCSSPSRAYAGRQGHVPGVLRHERGPQQRHLGGHRVAVLGQRGHPRAGGHPGLALVDEQHVHDLRPRMLRLAPPRQAGHQGVDGAVRHPAEVHHQPRDHDLRGGAQLLGRVPVGQGRLGPVGDGEHARVVAGDRPERTQAGEQLREQLAVAVPQGAAEHVGEVVLLGAQLVDGGDLVRPEQARPGAVDQVGRPGVLPAAGRPGAGPRR